MLKAVIVGPGSIAHQAYFPAYLGRDDVRVVGVLSRRRATAEAVARRLGLPHPTDELPELLGLHPDVAFCHAPTAVHAPLVAALLEAGVHVLCDKPLAPSSAEAERLFELAARRGRVLTVGFNRRFAELHARLRAAVPKVELAVAEKHRPAPRGGDFRATLWDEFIHPLDTAVWLGGRELLLARVEVGPSGLALAAAHLAGAGGGVFSAYMHLGGGIDRERLAAFGAGASAEVVDLEELWLRGGGEEKRATCGSWTSVSRRRGFQGLVDAFLAAARGEAPNPVPPEEALRTHRLIEALIAVGERGA